MKEYQQSNGTSVDSKKDIDFSTRYDDREFDHGRSDKEELDWLTAKIKGEVELSSDDILKMERLQERYHSDGLAAQSDSRMGYYMRYVEGYEQLQRLIEARYRPYHPVDDEGKQNGGQ